MCTRMTGFDHLYVRGHYGMSKEPRDCYALHQSFRLQPTNEIINFFSYDNMSFVQLLNISQIQGVFSHWYPPSKFEVQTS